MAPEIATQNSGESTNEPTITDIDNRDVRALTEYMTVLEDIDHVRDADDMYIVITESQYTVDLREGTCDCPDATYNLGPKEECKHEKRARYATGDRSIPAGVDERAIDPDLGEHVTQRD
ncbi:hypothetical protein [Natronococcus jeotgali]|uniref:SWIM-type domain-containing protein n=1 Tax=Natronococcus jeotgali DSM 18795 TaxID=1227498 RepID=L9XDM3_9EURY|nr:hypothetical protein [Natronococcus jeotgali]ELY58728.1 hypothetical protein C492_11585 [Natronococcus jeotgali DSM 18795]